MRGFIFAIGIILMAVGFVGPIPGPLDDPVDWLGTLMVVATTISKMKSLKA